MEERPRGAASGTSIYGVLSADPHLVAFPDVTDERRHGAPASCFGIDEANCPRMLLEPVPPVGERTRPNQVIAVVRHDAGRSKSEPQSLIYDRLHVHGIKVQWQVVAVSDSLVQLKPVGERP
jgi:hypothetical protein